MVEATVFNFSSWVPSPTSELCLSPCISWPFRYKLCVFRIWILAVSLHTVLFSCIFWCLWDRQRFPDWRTSPELINFQVLGNSYIDAVNISTVFVAQLFPFPISQIIHSRDIGKGYRRSAAHLLIPRSRLHCGSEPMHCTFSPSLIFYYGFVFWVSLP